MILSPASTILRRSLQPCRLLSTDLFLNSKTSFCRHFSQTTKTRQSLPASPTRDPTAQTQTRPPIQKWVRTSDNYLHDRMPKRLYEVRVGKSAILRRMLVANPEHEPKRNSSKPNKEISTIDGLLRPFRIGADAGIVLAPHGLRFEPRDSFFYKRLQERLATLKEFNLEGRVPVFVTEMPQDALIPEGLELVQDNFCRYYLQCSRPMSLEEMKERAARFTKDEGVEMPVNEFLEKYPPPIPNKQANLTNLAKKKMDKVNQIDAELYELNIKTNELDTS